MGNLIYKNKANSIVESIRSLNNVEMTLQCLIDKYQNQIDEERNKAKQKMNSQSESSKRHIKKSLLIRRHQQQLENRMLSLLNKRYTLESLNVTKMHLSAIKMTTNTFKHFLKANDIDKVCDMQETLTEMISDACDITEVISSTDLIEVDDNEIENEYLEILRETQKTGPRPSAPPNNPVTPMVFPSVPSVKPVRHESTSSKNTLLDQQAIC